MENNQNYTVAKSQPLYEAEIIEENEKNDIDKYTSDKPVLKKTSIVQKIGKTIGAIAAIAGMFSEIKQYLPNLPSKNNDTGDQKNFGKQRRRLRSRR